MPDSIIVNVDISGLTISAQQKGDFPYKRKIVVDHLGVILRSDPVGYNVKSPLTGANYYIIPVFKGGAGVSVVLMGYKVQFHIPACTVGNNVLNQNLVLTGCKFAVLLLKHFLQGNGCPAALLDLITLDLVTIDEVTLTFLYGCGTHAAALNLNDQLYLHADAVLNAHPAVGKQPVFRVGNGKDSTTYCKHKDFELIGYVKSGKTQKAFCNLKGQSAADMYAAGQACVRFETKFKAGYLKKHGLEKPLAWKITQDCNPHRVGVELARQHLRLDENLRTVRPKPAYIAKLSPNDQVILTSHLGGNNVLHHSLVGKNQHQFGMYRARILTATRVDINIPWNIQCKQISTMLADTLVVGKQFQVPLHLKMHSFCAKTAKALLNKLHRLVLGVSAAAPVQSASAWPNHQPPKLPTSAASTVVARVRGITPLSPTSTAKLGKMNLKKRIKW